MYIRIEKIASAPISKQIAEQIRAQCLSGILKPGTAVPSVRQLSKELAVNVNTVFRVYEKLTAEGFLEMRQGEGTFVLPPSAKSEAVQELKKQQEQLEREFQALIRRGLLLGLSVTQMRGLLNRSASEAKTELASAQS